MIRIEFLSGDSRGRMEAVDTFPFKIGRSSGCAVRIDPEKDLGVSGEHVEIRQLEDGNYEIEDLSKNGTILNGKPVEKTAPLTKFSTVELGKGGPRIKLVVEEGSGFFLSQKKDKVGAKKPAEQPIKATIETRAFDLDKIEGDDAKKKKPPILVIAVAAVVLVGGAVAYFVFLR